MEINPLSPLFAIIIFVIAYLTAYIINRTQHKEETISTRNEAVNGLRGVLATGVFLHHASIWYQYIQLGAWRAPESNFYVHIGQTRMTLFFMITSFLFVSKLINYPDDKEYNWKQFFISRIYRLGPMYYFSLAIIILYVMIISQWKLQVGVVEFVKSILEWTTYGIAPTYYINNVNETGMINANVYWSLAFEWLFYFSMPILGLIFLKKKPSLFYIVPGTVFVIVIIHFQNDDMLHNIISFAGGAIAPFIIKYTRIGKKAESTAVSLLIIVCVILIGVFGIEQNLLFKLLVAIVFTCVALGNSLFGIFKNASTKLLGEISYSMYLLHGIIIFTVFYFGFGIEKSKQFSQTEYSIIVFTITPILILVSFLGFKCIEEPFVKIYRKRIDQQKTSNNISKATVTNLL